MRKIFAGSAVVISALALTGCVVAPPVPVSPAPQPGVVYEQAPVQPSASAEIDLMPPLPTFATIADCELAYGPGQCGTGAALYAQANMAPPPNAINWFAPFAFGVMTGVLVNQFFAPPTVYYSSVHYHSYLAPVVVERYRVVTPVVVERYRHAPPEIRRSVWSTGPVRYDTRRHSFVGNPYGSGYSHPLPAPRPVISAPRPPEPARPPVIGRPAEPMPMPAPGARPPADRPGAPGWQNPGGRPVGRPAPADVQNPGRRPPERGTPPSRPPADAGQPAAVPQVNRAPVRPAVEPTRRIERATEAARQSAPAPQQSREAKQNERAKEKRSTERPERRD